LEVFLSWARIGGRCISHLLCPAKGSLQVSILRIR